MRKSWSEKESSSQGATLLEVVVTATILALLVMAFGGFLRSIAVGGRNIPQGENILTQQQVIDQVNAFVIRLSRDIRSAAQILHITGEEIKILSSNGYIITYQFQEGNGVGKIVMRKENGEGIVVEEREALRGVKGNGDFFSPTGTSNPDYVFVKLPVQYLAQTGRGKNDLEEREFSFIIVHRRVSD